MTTPFYPERCAPLPKNPNEPKDPVVYSCARCGGKVERGVRTCDQCGRDVEIISCAMRAARPREERVAEAQKRALANPVNHAVLQALADK